MASATSSELEYSPPKMSGIGLAALASGCSAPLAAPRKESDGPAPAFGRSAPLKAPHKERTGAPREPPSPLSLATSTSLDGPEELWASSLPAEATPALPDEDAAGAITRVPTFFFFFGGARATAAPFLFLDSASTVTFFAEAFFFFLSIEARTSAGTSRSR